MKRYSKEELRKIFQSPFNQDAWKAIVINLFRADKVRSVKEKFTEDEDREEGYYLGSAETPDSYRIGLFYYRIKQGSVAHKKVGLRNLVKGFINQNWGEFDAAIVVFDSGQEWRLSFVCDIKEQATAPKRFTFVFGEKDNQYRTPIERFDVLQGQEATFENIRKAFSVEALSDDFFNEYRELYADFVQYITGKRYVKESGKWVERPLDNPNHQYEDTFEGNDKLVRDYIKKMFGRIVFCISYSVRDGLPATVTICTTYMPSRTKKIISLMGCWNHCFSRCLMKSRKTDSHPHANCPELTGYLI